VSAWDRFCVLAFNILAEHGTVMAWTRSQLSRYTAIVIAPGILTSVAFRREMESFSCILGENAHEALQGCLSFIRNVRKITFSSIVPRTLAQLLKSSLECPRQALNMSRMCPGLDSRRDMYCSAESQQSHRLDLHNQGQALKS